MAEPVIMMLASQNPHKLRELQQLLGEGPWQLESMAEHPDVAMPPETGQTFAANAQIKADAVREATGCWALGDDSGLVVDCLNGFPGVISARYAGTPCNDARNNEKLVGDLVNTSAGERSAHFVCVLALSRPDTPTRFACGTCTGVIGTVPRGTNGFGYDPLFYFPELGKTMAELSPAEKNRLSHRAHAAIAMRKILLELLSTDLA